MNLDTVKLEVLNYMERLNIKILDMELKQDIDKLFMGFKTQMNSYEIEVDNENIKDIDDNSRTKWTSTLFMTTYYINTLSYHIMFNMINQMANAGDTSAIGLLIEAICKYWDEIFSNPGAALSIRALNANNQLHKFLSGSNEYIKVWFHDPTFFLHFVTGGIANKVYYEREIYKRVEMQEKSKGCIIL